MKYLKTYENINMPKIGDYVIVDASHGESIFEDAPIFLNFLKTIIGKIIDIKNYDEYKIEYDMNDIPAKFKNFFYIRQHNNSGYLVAWVDLEDIKDFSNKKEKLEIIKKYNL